MQNLLSILFYIRKSKDKEATQATVYLRITYDSKRAEASTMRKVSLGKWNAQANKVVGSSIEAKQVNRNLDIIKNRIYEIYQKFLDNGEEITAIKIKDEFLGNNDTQKSILQMFEEHNMRMEKLIGKDYSFRTLQRYKTTKKHLASFITSSFKLKDYKVRDIDVKFINSFIYYLKTKLDLSHNSALKYLSYLKKIVRIAYTNGWVEKDPFYNFKLKVQVIDREFLTKEEIIKIMEKEFTIPRMEHVRDVFLFSCYTGLAYVDVFKLTADDIIKGIDGNKWIKTKRTKTKTLSSIPILPVAEKLIEKYGDLESPTGKLLPVYTNQRMNSYLKEIADSCDIKKNLTFHMARHTFATTVTLSNGVPIESVSKMLGHRSLKTTQHYAKILDEKLSEDMNLLKARILAGERMEK
ncbi:site-specific integrase [Christiangramia sediminis]|uniref:Site-specific integrase n=1 Tax=Christiangramia sediminis TaxID=2881336 RepID=A0A9X1LKJ6_9FLAO|nr:site-specific integrase [Christiangramia sediminis]MCB7482071.1 site-specific integrase [Christiangramia sediminis]